MRQRQAERLSVPIQRARVTTTVSADQVLRVVSSAFCVGAVTRTELLVTAVAEHAPTPVFNALLRLPERRYNDVLDLRGQLLSMTA